MTELRLTPELIETFLEEVDGYLRVIESWLDIEEDSESPNDFRKIVETAHSLKGVTGMIGQKAMHEAAAALHSELAEVGDAPPTTTEEREQRVRELLKDFTKHFEGFRLEQQEASVDVPPNMESCVEASASNLPSCEDWREELDDIGNLADNLRSGWDSEKLVRARDSVRRLLQCEKLPESCQAIFTLYEKTVCWMIADARHFSNEAVEFLNLLAVSVQEICDEVHEGRDGRTPLENFLSMASLVAPEDLRSEIAKRIQALTPSEGSGESDFLIGFEAEETPATGGGQPAEGDDALPGDDMLEGLSEIFREEGREQLKQLRNLLDNMQPATVSDEEINAIFRIVHTLKGSAAMVGKAELSRIIHDLEDILDEVREGQREMSDLLLDGLYNSMESLFPFVHQDLSKDMERGKLAALSSVIQDLRTQLPAETSASPKVEASVPDIEIKTPALERSVRVELASLESIMDMVSELRTTKVRIREFVPQVFSAIGKIRSRRKDLSQLYSEIQKKYYWAIPLTTGSGLATPQSEFGQLEFDRYSGLSILSREIEETDYKLTESLRNLERLMVHFSEDTLQLDKVVHDLQEEVIKVRMIPFSTLFKYFEFQVRRLSQRYQIQARLSTSGGETEVDKVMADLLSESIGHMIRNSFAHGFESMVDRDFSQKSEIARISIEARQIGSHLIVVIEDDGRGINIDRLKRTVLEKEIVSEEQWNSMSDNRRRQLIFLPQVTTRTFVDQGAGRGVGLDVVRHQIDQLFGSISVDSEKGVGTRFVIRLPLSLAIQDMATVRCRTQDFLVPMSFVEHFLEPRSFPVGNGSATLEYEGRRIPACRLHDFLRFEVPPPSAKAPFVVLRSGDEVMAMMVDAVLEREQIILRKLSPLMDQMNIFLGSTINPQGSALLAVNVPYLFLLHQHVDLNVAKQAIREEKLRIMVADDSLTVRRSLRRMLERYDFEVKTAKDGLDAWQQINIQVPDLVLVDLEMPNIDGYELMKKIRQEIRLSKLPLVVISSRGGPKHLKKAERCGADAFLSKPVLERTLLTTLRGLLPARWLIGEI